MTGAAVTKSGVLTRIPWQLRVLAKWVCAVGIALLVWNLSHASLAEISSLRIHWRPQSVLLILAGTAAYYVLNAYSWHRITVALDIAIPWREAFSIWSLTQLGKYLPGKVLVFAGRAAPYRLAGHPVSRIGGALWLEMQLRVAAALAVFLVAWSTTFAAVLDARLFWVLAGLCLALLLTLRSDVMRYVARLYGKMRGVAAPAVPPTGALLACFAIEVAAWLVAGASFYGLLTLFGDVPFLESLRISGAVALSGVGGFLSFFVPAGLGVREGIFVGLAKLIVPLPAAIGASVLARLWTTIFEVVLGAVALVLIDGREDEQIQRVYE